jgi:hypothetical protein
MTYDRRRSIYQLFFVLQTVALAVGLASIDKAFEKVDQYFGRAGDQPRKTVERVNNAAHKRVTAAGPAVDHAALAARANAALNAVSGFEASIIGVATSDGLDTIEGATENATGRDRAERPRQQGAEHAVRSKREKE